MPNSFVGLLNTSPFFATRPFLATLLIGLVARFTNVLNCPTWFVSDLALGIMAILALIELFGTKTDLGRFLDEFTPVAKGALSFLLVLLFVIPGVSEGASAAASGGGQSFQSLLPEDFSSSAEWGLFGLTVLWPVLSGVSVWVLAWLRSSILSALVDLDEDDDLGVQGFFSWIEDFWTISGVLVALFFPILALAVYGMSLVGLFITQRYIAYVQEKRKVSCPHCQTSIFSTALYCPNCSQPNMEPKAVGLFGQALERRASNAVDHHHNLITRKRCPVCATRLPERSLSQNCTECETTTFPDHEAVEQYLARVRETLPRTLLICLMMSFVPILGILPGVIYYRLAFVSSLRGYIQRRTVFLVRFMLILFNILLVSVQWIPFLGALSIPIMCLSSYWVYQKMLRRAARREFNTKHSKSTQEVSYAL